jgi:hypothetical protein
MILKISRFFSLSLAPLSAAFRMGLGNQRDMNVFTYFTYLFGLVREFQFRADWNLQRILVMILIF